MNTALSNVISPVREMLSWETLWGPLKATQKQLTDKFREWGVDLPSQALARAKGEVLFEYDDIEAQVTSFFSQFKASYSVCVAGTFHYPARLRDARYPVELFYYKGDIGLLESKSVSIVGARKCTEAGAKRARRLAREMVDAGYSVVSGLAAGIDTAAMESTIEHGGQTIGVIGTPINQAYPKQNISLQESVATKHLLVSHVPFYRYSAIPFQNRRFYFPERNAVMSALSKATIIVEASETSGTLTQARACEQQGRKLFILNSCFETGLRWPEQFEARGAIRVHDTSDILDALQE